ncbi:MAG: hypothetical protein KDA45_14450 [Planctomycetales bacterium]|nr:hypothetical protein [Planctomycetales bacterium]
MAFSPPLLITLLAATGELLSRGLSIALVGLLIVFLALLLITLFIAAMPRLLIWIGYVWAESGEHHSHEKARPVGQVSDEEAVLAAIGFVLHTELQRQLAVEQKSGN